MKKSYRIFFALALCAAAYIIDFSEKLPREVTLFVGQAESKYIARGIKLDSLPESIAVNADEVVAADAGVFNARLNAFGVASREINLNVLKPLSLSVGGELVGIKLKGAGVIVIGFDESYSGSSLRVGDVITSINSAPVTSYRDFAKHLQEGADAVLGVRRGNLEFTVRLRPRASTDGEVKLGIWVRDSAAGVGTITFADNEKGIYGALGHGINETDTGVRFPVGKGSVEISAVASVTKGERGSPGEITGAFIPGAEPLGTIEANTDCGIFGRLISEYAGTQTLRVALAGEVKTGEAKIICNVGEGAREYSVNILRINRLGTVTKGILLEITDPNLKAITGGIVRGMSGSPIVQNQKLVGAVTHVLVNDPTTGYGIFIENMLSAAG